jgi:hypothetical protein
MSAENDKGPRPDTARSCDDDFVINLLTGEIICRGSRVEVRGQRRMPIVRGFPIQLLARLFSRGKNARDKS